MHYANEAFWQYCSSKYKAFFGHGRSVVEYGSYNINGSIRPILNSSSYVGLDWRAGPSVDVVSLAHEFKSEIMFNAVVSASMLEHDPYWEKSLENMSKHLLDDGILILSWGAARNGAHCLAEAPDGAFHALKAGLVIDKLNEMGFTVFEFWYEKNLAAITGKTGGNGEVCLVAFKSSKIAQSFGVGHIDQLFEEDKSGLEKSGALLRSASDEEIEQELVRRKNDKALASIPSKLTTPLWGSLIELVKIEMLAAALDRSNPSSFSTLLKGEAIRAIYGQPGINWYLDKCK